MATVAYTVLYESVNCKIIKWTGLTTTNNDGAPYILAGKYADKNAQVLGTFGVGGSVAVEGTNQITSADWVALNDPAQAVIAITAAKVKQILENTLQIRPHVTAGDGTTSLTCLICIRK
jgi:hypothetical protein